jgi:hypothetical protein
MMHLPWEGIQNFAFVSKKFSLNSVFLRFKELHSRIC